MATFSGVGAWPGGRRPGRVRRWLAGSGRGLSLAGVGV